MIFSDILSKLDNTNGTILALLDLSSAFDTINYTILLRRISGICICTGTAYSWLKSFITELTSSIHIHPHTTKPHMITNGISSVSRSV